MELWRDIPGYEGWYQASDQGRIRRIKAGPSTHSGLIRKATADKKGYLRIGLSTGGRPVTHKVHRLIALTWIGLCPDGLQVNHKDGNKQNNCVENLEYTTNAQDMRHAITIGLRDGIMPKGANSSSAKLGEDQVREIKRLLRDTNLSQRAIGDLFGVEKTIIGLIYRGKNWSHIQIEPSDTAVIREVFRKGENHHGVKVTETQVRQIRALCEQGYKQSKVAQMLNVSPSLVSAIVVGRLWKHVD